MFEVLNETPRRLVIASGNDQRRFRHVLDKDAGFAWFERGRPPWPHKVVRLPLAGIAAVQAVEVQPPRPEGRLIITSSSGRSCRADVEAGAAADAAAAMRGFLELPETAVTHASVAAPQAGRWLAVGALASAVIAAAWFGYGFLASQLVLPDCDSAAIRTAVTAQLQARSADPVGIGEITRMRQSRTETACQARITVNGDSAVIGYRVSGSTRAPAVRVTGPVGVQRLDHARINAIPKAVDDFLDRARESYQSGSPPRQSDPAVDALLTTIFDTSDLAGILAPSEIDAAIDWFNTANAAGNVYLLAGTGYNDLAKLPANEAIQQRLRGNVVRFADEFGRFADFQMQILSAIAQAQMSFIANGPDSETASDDFKSRVAEVRTTFVQAMKSDFISLVYDGLSNDWRMSRLATLARVTPVISRFLSREDARGIAAIAGQTLDYLADPTVKETVRKVAAGLAPPT